MTAYEQTMQGFVERIEALERDTVTFRTFEVALERIDKLERIFEADAERFVPDAEVRRHDRWHATYNAVRGGMEAATSDLCPVNDAHEYAAEAADRAHGPLEAVDKETVTAAPYGERTNRAGSRRVDSLESPEVNALVKERQEVHKLVTVVQHWKYQLASSEALRSVNEALKPFEVQS